MAALREGWHHSRFQPYLKSLAPRVAPEATTLGAVSPRVCAEVDVGALLHNADACRAAAEKSGCGVIAVVKADAYGHGAAVVARALHKHAGIDFFAVATLPEALELRAAGLEPGAARVLVLGASVPSEWNVYARFGLEMVVESRRTAELLGRLGKDAGPLKAHVMLNTGMNRIGLATFDSTTETHGRKSEGVARPSLAGAFADLDVVPEDGERSPVPLPPAPEASKAPLPRSDSLGSLGSLGSSGRCQVYHGVQVDQAVCVVAAVARAPAVEVAGLCTHMADATANTHRYTQRQFGRFRDVVVALAEGGVAVPLVHVENSETLLSAHVGPERMRRLIAAGASGGYCRVGGALYGQRGHDVLRPVLSLKAQDCLIATLAIGFADGYPRSLSNRGVVAVRGHRFRVAGKVCMDMCMVYLGPVGGPGACVEVGDYATLWGDAPGAASLAETAEMVGTAQSDLTCDLSRRVARRYVNLPPDWETPELFAS